MLKKIDGLLNIFMGAFVGAFLGTAVYRYLDYKNHPEFYIANSAPWYTGVLITGVVLAAFLLLCIVLKVICKKKMK